MPIPVSDAGRIGKPPSSRLVFKDPALLPLLAVGEETKISVLQRLPSGQYLVAVKDRRVLADSASPLKPGGELRVRVDAHHPAVVLRILSEMASPPDVFTENLRVFRANPHGLLTHFVQLEELLGRAVLHGGVTLALRDDCRVLLQAMQALHYRQDAVGKTGYLKDYLVNLGLLLESDLKKLLHDKGTRQRQDEATSGGVKGLLLRLAAKVNALLGDETLQEETRGLLAQLQPSLEKSVKTLENQQILNVMLQEREHTHLLQIPMPFPGGMKLGEIFIRSDDHGAVGAGGTPSFTVALLLDMDALGHLLVEVHARDKKLDCVCRCRDEGVREFLSAHLAKLRAQLASAGYRVERLNCVVAPEGEQQESAWHRQNLLFAGESVNLFA